MSVSYIPEKVKLRLWGKAGGHCQYYGCVTKLWIDSMTQFEFNAAYIAHIIADQPDGPRGDAIQSKKLKADLSNLMLMCDIHHRMIDRDLIDEHPAERLREMKRIQEDRMEFLGDISPGVQSHVLLYGANVGEQSPVLSLKSISSALLPDWYPADRHPFQFGLSNSAITDREPDFWLLEKRNLERLITQHLRPRFSDKTIKHLSIFALAPQPLLTLLGSLLSDIPLSEVYQLHREPQTWQWQDNPHPVDYIVQEPTDVTGTPALVFSLSATIVNTRILDVLPDANIWHVTVPAPNNDFLKSRLEAQRFREVTRVLLNQIKAEHGQDATIHVFPAMPVALAVELGRVWMPKADLTLKIYDENRQTGGFGFALTIGGS